MEMIGSLIEIAAAAAWKRDYPKGGSLYQTYESTNFQDKEVYRKEVAPIVAAIIQATECLLDNSDIEALLGAFDFAVSLGKPLEAIRPNIEVVRALLANTPKGEMVNPAIKKHRDMKDSYPHRESVEHLRNAMNEMPSSKHGQRITFEGSDYILLEPEALEELEAAVAKFTQIEGGNK